ncbi:MAG: beta-lactamase family protein [Anaerolineales bacterium]|nr:beta-lactamase family protein [Anaerolineales bacterium]
MSVVLPPGSEYMYSGGGYTRLQLITEEVTGEPFTAFMQREILALLGMDNSSFEWNPGLQPMTAIPYGVGGRPLPNYRHIARAASGLRTTVISLARFVAAGTTGPDGEPPGRGVLVPATLDQMFSPAAATDGRQGLGYRTERMPCGTHMVLHGGASLGWKAQIAALPERGAGIVILTNRDLGDDLTADVLCLWSRWATGEVPLICQVVPKERNYALAVAGLLAVGLVACAGRVGAEIRSGRRQLDCTWRQGLFCSLAVLDTALWRLLWYTDTVSVLLEVWRDSAPRLLMPATFDWVTWAATLWALVVAAACLFPREIQPDAARAPAN